MPPTHADAIVLTSNSDLLLLTSHFRQFPSAILCAWMRSRSLVNLSTSNPSPAMKPRWEIISTENYAARLSDEEDAGRGHALQRLCYFARTAPSCRCVLHAHGHGAAVHPFLGRCNRIYGRGSCDAKGIIAAQIAASERLAGKKSTLACSLSWEKSATAWERK